MANAMTKGAGLTLATLFGGLLAGLVVGDLVFHLIPGSSVENVQIGHAAIASVPALMGFLAGGAAWGMQMGRLAGVTDRRLALAGMVGFAPITIVLALGLGIGERWILQSVGSGMPIHRLFTLLFAPAAFLIAGTSVYALGRSLGANAVGLFWRVGLAASGAFLAVNLAMEAMGWVVGAPGAAERATMVTVLAVANVGAALAGGAVLGQMLATVSKDALEEKRG